MSLRRVCRYMKAVIEVMEMVDEDAKLLSSRENLAGLKRHFQWPGRRRGRAKSVIGGSLRRNAHSAEITFCRSRGHLMRLYFPITLCTAWRTSRVIHPPQTSAP